MIWGWKGKEGGKAWGGRSRRNQGGKEKEQITKKGKGG
jgi:hypothetical protein